MRLDPQDEKCECGKRFISNVMTLKEEAQRVLVTYSLGFFDIENPL